MTTNMHAKCVRTEYVETASVPRDQAVSKSGHTATHRAQTRRKETISKDLDLQDLSALQLEVI